MKKSSSNVSFWILTIVLLTIVFGRKDNDYVKAFYFVALLLPVIVGTSYLFNQLLIPQYLQKGKRLKFALYSIYALITSVYLEMLILILAYVYLANYKFSRMNPLTTDVISLTVTLYFIVLLRAFILLFKLSQEKQQTIHSLESEREKVQQGHLLVRANRQNTKILHDEIYHLESLSDYVKIYTPQKEPIMTKEKISNLEQRLPQSFLRIHRSYIVNINKVDSFTKETVCLGDNILPISRTYKSKTLEILNNKG